MNLTTADPSTEDAEGISVAKVLDLVGPLFADEAERATLNRLKGRDAGQARP